MDEIIFEKINDMKAFSGKFEAELNTLPTL
jgi:hypothetical protein